MISELKTLELQNHEGHDVRGAIEKIKRTLLLLVAPYKIYDRPIWGDIDFSVLDCQTEMDAVKDNKDINVLVDRLLPYDMTMERLLELSSPECTKDPTCKKRFTTSDWHQPLRILIRLIIARISSSTSPLSPVSPQVKCLVEYLNQMARSSFTAAYIVGQEIIGSYSDTPLPFTNTSSPLVYPTATMPVLPLMPLIFQNSSLCTECHLLMTILITVPPFRHTFNRAVVEQYITVDHDANPLVSFVMLRYSFLYVAVTFKESIPYTTHPEPSHNLIHQLLKRIRSIFSMSTNDYKNQDNAAYIKANNMAIVQSMVSCLKLIQGFSPMLRELTMPSEYETPYYPDLSVCLGELLSNVIPKLFELGVDQIENSLDIIIGGIPTISNDRFISHQGSEYERYCVTQYLLNENVLNNPVLERLGEAVVSKLMNQLSTKEGKIPPSLWKEDLINSITSNLCTLHPALDNYIQSNETTLLQHKNRLELKAKSLAAQKSAIEKMFQQQKSFARHMDIDGASKSQDGHPLGALCRIEDSWIRVLSYHNNLSPAIIENRPDYNQEFKYKSYDIPSNSPSEIPHTLEFHSQTFTKSISSCKHLVHQSCLSSYTAKSHNSMLTCPLCDSLCDSVLIPIELSPTSEQRSNLQSKFYMIYTKPIFSFCGNPIYEHLMIPLAFSNIEALEIRARPTTFMAEESSQHSSYYVLTESEFQSQLTTARIQSFEIEMELRSSPHGHLFSIL
eukprot:gene19404-23234_t